MHYLFHFMYVHRPYFALRHYNDLLTRMTGDWTRAVPEFGSDSGRNPAFFTNPAPVKIGPDFKFCRIWKTFINYIIYI